jgi:predicted ester cyclase
MATSSIVEGDKVVIRARATGTHQGEFMSIPPTGNRIEVPLIDIMRIRDGKIAEHWGVMDDGVMMQQLGVGG